MTSRVSIVKPDEQVRIRRGKTPLAARVRQVITAVEVLQAKGAEQFTSSQLAREIDQRLQAGHVMAAIYALVEKGVLVCTTPERLSDRAWAVKDSLKMRAFRDALESGEHVPQPDMSSRGQPSSSLLARLVNWFRSPSSAELHKIEQRLMRLEERFEHLIGALGGE